MQAEVQCLKCNTLMEETECFDSEDRGEFLWRLCEYQCPHCKSLFATELLIPLGKPNVKIIEEV